MSSSYHTVFFKTCACVAAAALLFAGCNKKSNPSVNPQFANVSGDYSGTFSDSVLGSATALGTLTQHAASAGGSMNVTSDGGAATAQIAIVLTASNKFAGSIVIDQPDDGPACTFSTSGTYSNDGSSNAALSGTYTAVSNCSGETGTYTLAQQCSDVPAIRGPIDRFAYPPKC